MRALLLPVKDLHNAKKRLVGVLSPEERFALAEAMPAGKYNFAPWDGEFKGARSFALQVKHLATVIYMVAAAAREDSGGRG